jgi:O-antigen/teichoic acid export membrane protein
MQAVDAEATSDVLDTPAAGGMVLRGGVLRFGSYVLVVALSVISAAVLTRHLGPARFGVYTTVISLVNVIASITDAGMSNLGIREYSARAGEEREALMRDLLGLRVMLTMLGVLIATGFALAAGYDPALLAGTVLAALSVIVVVLQHTFSIPLASALRFGALSVLEVARQAITVVLIVALILVKAGLLPLLAVALVANLTVLAPTAALVRGQISMRLVLRPRRWAALLRLTVAFSLASAANTLYLYAAQIVTSLVAGSHQSGLFAASFRVFIVVATVPGLLVASALPLLARAARDDRTRLGYALQRTFEVSTILGVAALLGSVVGARFIIEVVGGPKYAGAAAALRIEGVALLASFVLAGWGFGLLSLHRHRALLTANICALIVSVVLTVVLAKTHGARGAALASACGEATLAILYLIGLVRADPKLRPRLTLAFRTLLAAVPAAVVGLVPSLPSVLAPLVSLSVFGCLVVLFRAIPGEVYELLPARMRPGGG